MPGTIFSEDPKNRIPGEPTVFIEYDFDCIEVTAMWDIHVRYSKTYSYFQLEQDEDVVGDFINSASQYYNNAVTSQN